MKKILVSDKEEELIAAIRNYKNLKSATYRV